jgi:hypothetical protein
MTSDPKNHPPVKKIKFPSLNEMLKPLAANEFNAQAFLDGYGVECKFNGMLFDVETTILQADRVSRAPVSADWLMTRAQHHGLNKEFVYGFMASHAPHCHPVVDWLAANPDWDGEDHIGRLMDCLTLDPEIPPELARTFVTKWLIGAVGVACNGFGDPPMEQGPAVLVFVGPQGIGKSRLLPKLVPDRGWVKTEQTLVIHDKDAVMALTRCWLVELGELDETMRRNSDGAAKQFLTRAEDIYRQPYGRRELRCPRRTAYIASINDRRFLRDPTGNRRFWPLPVQRIDLESLPAPSELWAQAYTLFKEGQQWWLTEQEGKALAGLQEDFKQVDGLTQIIADLFVAVPADARPSEAQKMVEIQQYLAQQKIQFTPKDAAQALRAAGFERLKTAKGNVWLCTLRFTEDRKPPTPEPSADQAAGQDTAAAHGDAEPFFGSIPEGEAGD